MIIVTANDEKEKSLSIEDSVELVKKIKESLKESDIAKEICRENGHDIDVIDAIVIKIEPLDTSAETVNGEITLNESLADEEFEILMRYAIHELVHVFQHMEREGEPDPYEKLHYLDRPDETEAFKVQIEYEAEERGKNEAEDYVDELLEYHDIPEEKREKKKEEFLERVED